MQHLGRTVMLSQRRREFVFVRDAVEAAAAHDGDAKRIGNAPELRGHAGGLAHHDQPGFLSGATVEREVFCRAADSPPEMFGVVPTAWCNDRAAIVADRIPRNQTGAARAIEMLTQPLIRVVGFLVGVDTDEAIENLADGEWKEILVFVENGAHLLQQFKGCRLRTPRREAARTSLNSCGTAKQIEGGTHMVASGAGDSISGWRREFLAPTIGRSHTRQW